MVYDATRLIGSMRLCVNGGRKSIFPLPRTILAAGRHLFSRIRNVHTDFGAIWVVM